MSETTGYINNYSYHGVTVGLENFVGSVTFSNYSSGWTLDAANGKATYYGDGATQNITITDSAGHSITGGCYAYYGKRIVSTSPAVIVGVGYVSTGNTSYTHGGSVDSNYSVTCGGTYDNGSNSRLYTVRFF